MLDLLEGRGFPLSGFGPRLQGALQEGTFHTALPQERVDLFQPRTEGAVIDVADDGG
jgi:hypothetical protein